MFKTVYGLLLLAYNQVFFFKQTLKVLDGPGFLLQLFLEGVEFLLELDALEVAVFFQLLYLFLIAVDGVFYGNHIFHQPHSLAFRNI